MSTNHVGENIQVRIVRHPTVIRQVTHEKIILVMLNIRKWRRSTGQFQQQVQRNVFWEFDITFRRVIMTDGTPMPKVIEKIVTFWTSEFDRISKRKILGFLFSFFPNETIAKQRGYRFKNNPEIKLFDDLDLTFQLAVNTAQYGRVFEDRWVRVDLSN